MATFEYFAQDLTAYIDDDGDLIFEDEDGEVVALGNGVVHPEYEKSDSNERVLTFGPGDKITITF